MEKVCGTGGVRRISATTLLAARRSWLHVRLPIASCAFPSDAVVEMRLVAVVMVWIVVPRNGAPRVRDAVHTEGCGNGVGRNAARWGGTMTAFGPAGCLWHTKKVAMPPNGSVQ